MIVALEAHHPPSGLTLGDALLAELIRRFPLLHIECTLPGVHQLAWGLIADAVADLGAPAEIGRAFADFQRHLYAKAS